MHPSIIPSPRLDPDERVLSWSLLKKKGSGGRRHTKKETRRGREGRKEGEKERRREELELVCATYHAHAIHAVLACLVLVLAVPLLLLPSTKR